MLAFDVKGSGDKVFVFLHGFGGSGAVWKFQIETMAAGARCIVLDLPGHGQSAWKGEDLAGIVAEVENALSAENGQLRLVASSFGGLVAIRFAARHPDRVSALTLSGSLPRFTADDDYPAGLNPSRIRKLAGQFQQDVGTVLEMFFRSVFTMKERESAQYRRIKELMKTLPLPHPQALSAYLDLLEKEDLRGEMAGINKPVQFIFGDHDYICPLSVIDRLRSLYPTARFDVLADCGHFPFLSYPEQFNALLKEFSETHDKSQAGD